MVCNAIVDNNIMMGFYSVANLRINPKSVVFHLLHILCYLLHIYMECFNSVLVWAVLSVFRLGIP